MRITESQLRRVIREMLDENSGIANTPFSGEPLMGKYAWPDMREKYVNKPDGAEKEKNTKLEMELAEAIYDHMSRNIPLKKKHADQIWSFINAKMYTDILRSYSKGPVYRGMNVSKKWFEERYGPLPKKPGLMDAKSRYRGWIEIPLKMKTTLAPLGWGQDPDDEDVAGSSWTPSFEATVKFMNTALGSNTKYSTPIIFEADASNPRNRFIDLDPIYENDLMGLKTLETFDREVIGIGDVLPTKAYWFFSRHRDGAETDGSDEDFENFAKDKIERRKKAQRGD